MKLGGGGSSSSLEQILPIVKESYIDDVKQFIYNGIKYTIKTNGYYIDFYSYKPLKEHITHANRIYNYWKIDHAFPNFWEIDLGMEVSNITKICLVSAYYNYYGNEYTNLIHNLELYASLNGTDYSLITSYSHPNSHSSVYGDPIELNVDYFKARYIRFKFLDSYYSNFSGFGNLRIYRKPDDKVFLDKDNYIYGYKNNI